jgi:hypothetical protein
MSAHQGLLVFVGFGVKVGASVWVGLRVLAGLVNVGRVG